MNTPGTNREDDADTPQSHRTCFCDSERNAGREVGDYRLGLERAAHECEWMARGYAAHLMQPLIDAAERIRAIPDDPKEEPHCQRRDGRLPLVADRPSSEASAINFIRAARDFHNAGRDRFKPGYEQYGDLLDAAEALATSSPEVLATRSEQPAGDAARMREALIMARDLIAVIGQSRGNVWAVRADDPETAVCDTFDAIETALGAASLRAHAALMTGGGK